MIMYVDDLIEALNENNKTPMMEVRICGCAPISSVELNADHIDIYPEPELPSEEYEDRISELESDVEDLESRVDSYEDVINLVCDSVDEIDHNMNEYSEMHPDEWKILSQLDSDVLEDFVKTCIDWYNIEREVRI